MKNLVVLIAEVKYPSSEATYLTASAYVLEKGNTKALEAAKEDFKSHVETEGFKIVNMLLYFVPKEQIADAYL